MLWAIAIRAPRAAAVPQRRNVIVTNAVHGIGAPPRRARVILANTQATTVRVTPPEIGMILRLAPVLAPQSRQQNAGIVAFLVNPWNLNSKPLRAKEGTAQAAAAAVVTHRDGRLTAVGKAVSDLREVD